jgi:hypothetical protein
VWSDEKALADCARMTRKCGSHSRPLDHAIISGLPTKSIELEIATSTDDA